MKEENIYNFAILVNTCDLYEDAWKPFFTLLHIQWPNCPKKIYLNTETKYYKDEYFDIECINSNTKISWSDRFILAVNKIQSSNILFFLEDAFLLSPVNEKILISALNAINDNKLNVGAIRFIPHPSPKAYEEEILYNYFSKLPLESSLRNSTIVSLTRKDYLLKLLRKNENPWEYEKYGSIRSRRYSEKILIQRSEEKLAFDFEYQIKYGYGISRKKWLKNNKILFEKFGIECNFSNLGWYDYPISRKITGLKRSKKEKLLLPFSNPKDFLKIVSIQLKEGFDIITHIRNRF